MRQIFSTVGVEGSTLKAALRVKTTKRDKRERKLEAIKDDMRKRLASVPLLIIDDLGMRKLPHTAAEDLLEIIRELLVKKISILMLILLSQQEIKKIIKDGFISICPCCVDKYFDFNIQ